MSTELPPSSPLPTCRNCDGWGCRVCKNPLEVHASRGGEQGLNAAELEVLSLRNEVKSLRSQLYVTELERDERARAATRAYELLATTAETVESLAEAVTMLSNEVGHG